MEEYFGRFYQVIQILGGEVIPVFSKIHVLKLGESAEENALRMREHLELSKKQDGGSMNQAGYREKSRDYFISWCTTL